jgi:hypothetical protein
MVQTGPKTCLGGFPGGGDMVYSLSLSPTLGRQLGLTVYQLLREVLPVMIPETAPRPMGSPTDFVNSVKLDD